MMTSIDTFAEENGINPNAIQALIRAWLTFFRCVPDVAMWHAACG